MEYHQGRTSEVPTRQCGFVRKSRPPASYRTALSDAQQWGLHRGYSRTAHKSDGPPLTTSTSWSCLPLLRTQTDPGTKGYPCSQVPPPCCLPTFSQFPHTRALSQLWAGLHLQLIPTSTESMTAFGPHSGQQMAVFPVPLLSCPAWGALPVISLKGSGTYCVRFLSV